MNGKEQLIEKFNTSVKGTKPNTEKYNKTHDGKKGVFVNLNVSHF